MLSHELRNPLGAMVSATGLLKAIDSQNDVQVRTVEILERQARQMARLLDDLLEASRVTQSKIHLRRRVVDLRDTAAEAAEAVRSQAEAKGLDFEVDLGADPLHVYGDTARLQQIQINLLNNAVKYTARGGRMSLRLKREDSWATIRVTDNGDGIPTQMLDSIFDLFVQAKHTLDHAEGGLGVGLTLVRTLVEMHGGSVNARSDGAAKGSEFTVRLPLTAVSQMAHTEDPLRQSGPAPGTTVLVVEDNEDSRELLCTMLTQAGLCCYGAADGWAALRLLDEVCPQIVILDVGLPGMDGLEVARRIRSSRQRGGLCLIALTGYGRASDRQATTQAGFDYHLVKPVQPDELLTVLARAQASGDLSSGALH
jgi:two-component system CheB/CheR fusion protein